MAIDKAALFEQLRQLLQTDLDALNISQREIEAGTTHEESRQENDKDTRAIESSYLARGLAERVADLLRGLGQLSALRARGLIDSEKVVLGSLVTVEDHRGERQRYLLAPAGGGKTLTLDTTTTKVVTPSSPLGRSLLRREVGDEVMLRTPAGVRELELVEVR